MSDELAMIQVRLDALHRSLLEVKGAISRVERHRKEIDDLWDALYERENSIYTSTVAVKLPLDAARYALTREMEVAPLGPQKDALAKILDDVRKSQAAVEGVLESFERAAAVTRKMRHRVAPLKEQVVGRFAAVRAINLIEKQKENLDKLAAGNGDNQGKSREEVVAEAWKAYGDLLEADVGRLFNEYVDLLGGLALRDSGLDEGICQMADELIRRCEMVGGENPIWYSMTIPARREAMEETVARIIRLAFPEWTIWAVPLGAFEFGHVVVKQNANELGVAEDSGPAYAHYLADTFATYALGPAYACAAILLRFNPFGAYEAREQRPPDATRAYVIFQTLEKMNADGAGEYYTDLMSRLKDPWDGVVQQLNPGTDPVRSDAVADEAVKTMWDFLRNGAEESLYYSGERWQAIQSWPDLLREDGGAAKVPWSNEENEVRDLLSAAWDARSRDPAATERISAEAKDLWELVRTPAQPGRPGAIRT